MEYKMRYIPDHPLVLELGDWLKEGNPFQGWLMTLNKDELNSIATSLINESGKEGMLFAEVSICCLLHRCPTKDDVFNYEDLTKTGNEVSISLKLETLRREGKVDVEITGMSDKDWIYKKKEQGE